MIRQAGTHGSSSMESPNERAVEETVRIKSSRLFVLDTNVILHDAGCIFNFEEHDVALPITVLEELDRFKKGDGDIHFQARRFLRELDSLTGDVVADDGCSLGEGRGHIKVLMNLESGRTRHALQNDIADHRILNTALAVAELLENQEVILVTKDTNLRLKAKAFGLIAQDYTSDKLQNLNELYTGKRSVSDV